MSSISRISVSGNPVRPSRRGLTLLELVVVIGILVTLAGLLVPLLPNLMARASYANGATNIGELTKGILTYRTLNGSFPDGYDVLTASGSYASTLPWTALPSGFTVGALSAAGGVTSLNAAGIKTVYGMDTTTGHATFFSPANSTAAAIDATTAFLQVSATALKGILGQGVGAAANYTYVVLGVGGNCSLVGARKGGIQEAPVRGAMVDANGNPITDSNGNSLDPTRGYARFVAVYRVDTNGVKPAALVCCGELDPTSGLLTTDRILGSYYTDLTGSK